MMMTFNFDINGAVLFDFWNVTNEWEYAGTCVAVIVLAMAFEALSEYRARVHARNKSSSDVMHQPLLAEHSVSMASQQASGGTASRTLEYVVDPIRLRLFKSFLHMVQLGLSYLLMLVSMTYNVGYFLSIIVGAGIGYFLFARVRMVKTEVASCCSTNNDQ